MKVLSGREYIESNGFRLRKLKDKEYSKLSWFDCGDEEINDFFHKDAFPHKQELMAECYCFELNKKPLALVSLQNDSIHFGDDKGKGRNKFGQEIHLPFKKRYKSIPAVKIGRLGVHKDVQGLKIGSMLLRFCKYMFITKNRTGCRLITIDSYVNRIAFYRNNGFTLFPYQALNNRKENDTVIMYCDLKPYHN